MDKDIQNLVSRALDYDKQACLELAAWYREQGNSNMAEYFEKKSMQTKEDLEKATVEAQEEYRDWKIEQDKYYAEAMQKVWKGTPICMLCTQTKRISMLYWLASLGLLEYNSDIENFPYMTDEGNEQLYEAAQSFMKVHKRVHIAYYSKEVVREQYEKYGIKDFYIDEEDNMPEALLHELNDTANALGINVHYHKGQKAACSGLSREYRVV